MICGVAVEVGVESGGVTMGAAAAGEGDGVALKDALGEGDVWIMGVGDAPGDGVGDGNIVAAGDGKLVGEPSGVLVSGVSFGPSKPLRAGSSA